MSQAYLIVNISKCLFLDPHRFGETRSYHDLIKPKQVAAALGLAALLFEHTQRAMASWAGDRILICGDFAENGTFLPDEWWNLPIQNRSLLDKRHRKAKVAGDVYRAGNPPVLYHLARLCFHDVSEMAILALKDLQ